MTMYFPLVVHGAMLIEPTETEIQGRARPVHRRAAIDCRAGQGWRRGLKAAPVHAPRRRLDETLAARKPVLAWKTSAPDGADSGTGAEVGGG